jgi:NAD(P)-dependent dehydrogenase (short-subunit alcohol dehydrogenase family)
MPAQQQRVAVITGASRGIGKQTSLLLAERGFQVVIVARTEAPRPNTPGTLAETADAVRALGCDPLVIRADLGGQVDLDRVVTSTLERFGRADVLVNNAAYTVGKTLFTHIPDLTRDQWDKHFAINVTAPLMLIQGFWEAMKANGGGVVVNVTSGASNVRPISRDSRNETGLPDNGPAYGASKAALNRMANVIAQEGLPHRISVITIEPGFVLTETMAATFVRSGIRETAAISPTIPAAAIAYLCTCADPIEYSGEILSAPDLVKSLELAS